MVSLLGRIRVWDAQPGQDDALKTFHLFGLGVSFVIVSYKMQYPVRHQVLQVVRQRFALLGRFARADAEGERDVAQVPLRILRRGKGQDVGRIVLLAKPSVQFAHAFIVGQQDGDPAAVEIYLGQSRSRGVLDQQLRIGSRRQPGLVFDFDVDQIARPRLAASAS